MNTALLLVPSPAERLAVLEATLKQHLAGVHEMWRALREIHDTRLYRLSTGGQYQTFDDYCEAELGIARALCEAEPVYDHGVCTPARRPVARGKENAEGVKNGKPKQEQ